MIILVMFTGVVINNDTKQRPQVDPNVILTIQESCKGYPDGTVCTKRCLDISCDPKMARCYKVKHLFIIDFTNLMK